jgi:hypothetical protein
MPSRYQPVDVPKVWNWNLQVDGRREDEMPGMIKRTRVLKWIKTSSNICGISEH